MKKLYLPILGFLISTVVSAQTLSPNVIASGGGYFTGGGKSLSWTMGETFNKTLQSGNNMLTQGEQQPYIFLKLINVKAFIEGYYSGGSMQPVLYNTNLSANPTACDSITVELHGATSPYSTIASAKTLLHTDGNAEVRFPTAIINSSYYIAVRHRNSVETWSKNPVKFNDAIASFDFSAP